MTEPTTLPADPILEETCKTCRFWEQRHYPKGFCRRYPLVLEATTWPVTTADDWCGEYRRNPNENAEVSPSA